MSVASSCVRERAHHHGAPVVVPSADADAEEARDHHHHARRASSFSFSRPPREGGGSRPLVAALALAAVLALALVHHAVRRRDPSAAASASLASALRARLGASARLSLELREVFFLPFLRATVGFAAFLSALVAADRLFHFYVTTYWRVFRRADPPHRRWRLDPTPLPPTAKVTPSTIRRFPAVVVQLPMFNEKAVCRHVIDAACALDWPRSKLRVQILDDSTCEETKSVIDDAAFHWRERGVDVVVRRRATREGYKAGAMRDASRDVAAFAELCAVFDADFDPAPEFLRQTVPYFELNEKVGFVQARWTYANARESTLTRVQEISLNYHIRCEQYARHAAGLFFNFNGTAGVWRVACVDDAGGWDNRTTVEDMDLSLRAYLRGWQFVFLDDVTCLNEIPAGYDAYRKQQHRWSCGPMQLWRKATGSILNARGVTLSKKVYLVVFFFGTRMFATHVVSFFLYCVLIPICATAPEVAIPHWALVYVPVLVTFSTVFFTPGGYAVAVQYVLFENAMSVVKVTAMLAGLLEWSNAHEWVVTAKLGKWVQKHAKEENDDDGGGQQHHEGGREGKKRRKAAKAAKAVARKVLSAAAAVKARAERKMYGKECAMAALFFACAAYGVAVHAMWQYSVFLVMQGCVFLAFGLNKGLEADE